MNFWTFDKQSNFILVFNLNKYFLAWNLWKTFACINFLFIREKHLKVGE